MPPNEVLLLRLLWNPDDIDEETGQVKPTAFTSRDLSGLPGDHVSVDRQDIAVRANMEKAAQDQAAKADGVHHVRKVPLLGCLLCGEVRAVTYGDEPALGVEPMPISGNDAHCGIVNITEHKSTAKKKSKGYLVEVRGKLARLASPPVTFDEAFLEPPPSPLN